MQFRENIETNNLNFISTKLYGVNNSGNYLADGNMLVLDAAYNNSYNKEDVLKLKNSSENFGIFSEGKLLSIEARQSYNPFDTLQYQLNNVRIQSYQLKIILHVDSINTLMPVMVDRYTNIQYPLNWMDSLTINFNISSNPLSYASNRFYMLIKPVAILPLDKIELTGANINNKTNKLLFKVYNPNFIKQYEIQRSTTGNNFTTISTISLNINNQHQDDFEYIDQSCISSSNFYRIKVVNIDGSFQYSNLINITNKFKDFDITMSTNLISNNQVSLIIQSKNKGNVQFFVVDEIGRVMQSDKFAYLKGTQQNTINDQPTQHTDNLLCSMHSGRRPNTGRSPRSPVRGRLDHCDWRLALACGHVQSAASQHTQRAPTNMVDDDEDWIDEAADIHWLG
jgi:hypothetical protein